MPSRRELLAGATGSLALAAGCAGHLGSPDVVPCPETTTSGDAIVNDADPVERWRLGERIENPEPAYEPALVTIVNFDVEREISVVVTRDDADDPILDRTVEFGVEEYVGVVLVEPAVWRVELALPDGASKTHTVEEFDCKVRHYSLAVRCDGEFTMSGGVPAIPCPSYPVGESGTPSARDGPTVDNP